MLGGVVATQTTLYGQQTQHAFGGCVPFCGESDVCEKLLKNE